MARQSVSGLARGVGEGGVGEGGGGICLICNHWSPSSPAQTVLGGCLYGEVVVVVLVVTPGSTPWSLPLTPQWVSSSLSHYESMGLNRRIITITKQTKQNKILLFLAVTTRPCRSPFSGSQRQTPNSTHYYYLSYNHNLASHGVHPPPSPPHPASSRQVLPLSSGAKTLSFISFPCLRLLQALLAGVGTIN